jgi:hypothetical protein
MGKVLLINSGEAVEPLRQPTPPYLHIKARPQAAETRDVELPWGDVPILNAGSDRSGSRLRSAASHTWA